jgi:ABC-2 type transport system permease protein
VREIWIVLAKFLASLSLMALIFLCSLSYAVVLGRYGDPDWGPIYADYLAIMLHTGLLISLGLLMSSLTENQVVAAALSVGTFLMLWFADSVAYLLPRPLELFAINLSLIGHFKPTASGEVFLSDLGYFITLSLLALYLTTRRLVER